MIVRLMMKKRTKREKNNFSFYLLDVVRLILSIDKNVLRCYTLDTVKKGITKNEWNEYTKNWP